MIIPGADESKLVGWGIDQWRRMKDERLQKERIWTECWLAYNSKFGASYAEVKNYRSRRYLPLSHQAVEAVSSHLAQGVMPHDDWFDVVGRTPDDDSASKMMSALMKWQHFRSGWRTQMAKLLKQAVMFGNVPWAVLWQEDMRTVPDQAAHAENLGGYAAGLQFGGAQPGQVPVVPQTQVRKYDGPQLVVGDLFNSVIDRHSNEDGYALFGNRYFRTKEYIQDQAKVNPMTGWSMYSNTESLTTSSPILEATDAMRREVEALMGIRDIPKDMVELIELWGDFPMEGALLKNHVMVIANRRTLIRLEPNPNPHGKIPWQMFSLIPEPNEIYGKGILEPVLGLQDVANVRMNQVIDANSLIVNPMLKVRNTGVIDFENFVSAPGALHLVNDPDDITPLVIPDRSALGMQEVGFVSAQFNDITGAMKAFSTENYQKSATEVSAVGGMLQSRFAEMVRHIEQTFAIPALEMQIELNQGMMDEELWIRVVEPGPIQKMDPMTGIPVMVDPTGPAPMRISPDDIKGQLDIYPVGASWVANNQQQIASTIQMVQIFGQSPAAAVIKWNGLVKEMADLMKLRDSYKWIKTDSEIAYEQQLMAMQNQQQMGQEGGPGGPGAPQGAPGGGGVQSMAGAPGTPVGGGAGQGAVQQTAGGPQRAGY